MQLLYEHKPNQSDANFFLVAHIDTMIGKQKQSSGTMLIGRTKTFCDAKKYRDETLNTIGKFHTGFNGTNLTYKTKKTDRYDFVGTDRKNDSKQIIKSIDILSKQEYYNYITEKF